MRGVSGRGEREKERERVHSVRGRVLRKKGPAAMINSSDVRIYE